MSQSFALFPFIHVPFCSFISLTPVSYNQDSEEIKIVPYPSFGQVYPINLADVTWQAVESLQVQWLIERFNGWFSHSDTILVKGGDEPEYFAKTADSPAKIVFAHGFFASSLHEISHWCVAGKRRRLLNDFGYWYAPDGRNAAQQHAFEQVEIMPQAIECLLTLMCGKAFKVSQDNLFADFDTSQSTFAMAVANRAIQLWQKGEQTGEKLPSDAKYLLAKLQPLRPFPLTMYDIQKNFLQ